MAIRCNVHTNGLRKEIEYVETESTQTEWAGKWAGRVLYYDIEDDCKSLKLKEIRKALNLAFTTWDLEIAIQFKPAWWYDKTPDFRVEFKTANEDHYFRDRPSVLAYAYFPEQGASSGRIVFNNEYIWSLNGKGIKAKDAIAKGFPVKGTPTDYTSLKTYNIIHVLIHEIGHSIGLRHDVTGNKDGRDVMDAYYSGELTLSPRDIYRVRKKYPIRIFSNWSWYGRIKKVIERAKRRY